MDNQTIITLLEKLEGKFDSLDKRFLDMEKEFSEQISDLKKSIDPYINLKSSDSKSSSEDLNGETYSFIAEDNIDDLNITKNFGTKLPSSKDTSAKDLPPRKSMMEFKNISDDPTVRTYIQGAPVQDNIFLSELNIGAVTAFIYKVSTYQSRWKISITVGWNISESIVHLLANLNNISDATFRMLPNPKIEQILKKAVQPRSAQEFIENLQKLVKFKLPKEVRSTNVTFEIIYKQFLIYSSRFRKLVDFMTGDQESKELPPLEKKNKGLIYHFLAGLPETFGKHFYDILLTSKTLEKCKSFDAFVNEFERAVLEDGYKPYSNNKPVDSVMKSMTKDIDMLSALSPVVEEIHNETQVFNSTQVPTYSRQPPTQASQPGACFKQFMNKNCTDPSCKYSHRPEDLRKLAKDVYNSWNAPSLSSVSHSPSVFVPTFDQDDPSELVNRKTDNQPELIDKLSSIHTLLDSRTRPESVIPAFLRIGDTEKLFNNVLLDTGALHRSYISPMLFHLYFAKKTKLIRNVNSCVLLGDGQTTKKVTKEVQVQVSFMGPHGKKISAFEHFCVLETGYDMIIGLPAIKKHFLPVLFYHLSKNIAECSATHLSEILANISNFQPMFKTTQELAPEESDDVLEPPSSFPYALDFLGKPREESIKEFFESFPKQINPDMVQKEKLIKLLEEKGHLVFVPTNWDGINGLELLELDFDEENLPRLIKPKPRPINPRLYENAYKEFMRLLGYFYRKSTSSIASCLVIAPKATPPFIRFCGDYVVVNKFIRRHHGYIPKIPHELAKIKGFKVFIDLDLTNAFHQIKIGPKTSERLSVQTPWGQVEPMFLPEGVPPASIILQDVIRNIFSDFSDWLIFIFDNLLILANDEEDALRKLEIILDKCIERNIFLKFSKSWFGFNKVKFFGYVCSENSYCLDEDRIKAIQEINFPSNQKGMRQFLGTGVFFQPFVKDFAAKASPLYEMTKDSFDWNPETWKLDYNQAFIDIKNEMANSVSLYFPDYNLPWFLQTDASDYAYGACLKQIYTHSDGSKESQIIAILSGKFSDAALNWEIIKKEAFIIFYAIKYWMFFLVGKFFVIQTDHNNLRWMESSDNPMIIRWRIFLQSFDCLVEHIKGKNNVIADYMSRLQVLNHCLWKDQQIPDLHDPNMPTNDYFLDNFGIDHLSVLRIANCFSSLEPKNWSLLTQIKKADANDILKQVHNARTGHFGAASTMKMLDKYFPAHNIPFRVVKEFVETCPTCQKDRIIDYGKIKGLYRTIKVPNHRSAIGIDNVTLTPEDINGNTGATVIVNLFTGLVSIYPYKTISAVNTSIAVLKYICTYGLVEEIHTDPGSDFTSNLVKDLNSWLGTIHKFSLVDWHQSNGVERKIREIVRHLRALCIEERVLNKWSDDTVLPIISFIMNSAPNREIGSNTQEFSAFLLTFGNFDAPYLKFDNTSAEVSSKFIRELDDNFKTLREASKAHQEATVLKRSQDSELVILQPKALVLKTRKGPFRPGKLIPLFLGPFEVLSQYKNDVEIRHLAMGDVSKTHIENLKLFYGTKEEALELAMLDAEQHWVKRILKYHGFPEIRTTMEFLVEFADGDILWIPFSKDISDTTHFEDFCQSKPELKILLLDAKRAKALMSKIRLELNPKLKVGHKAYMNLKFFGYTWFDAIGLPDVDKQYIIAYELVASVKGKTPRFIASFPIFKNFGNDFSQTVDNYWLTAYGYIPEYNPDFHILVNAELIKEYPKILSDSLVLLTRRLKKNEKNPPAVGSTPTHTFVWSEHSTPL